MGESGSGKTSLAICLLKLLPDNAHIKQGRILLNGIDLAPAEKTIAWGKKIFAHRAELTVAAIKKAEAGE